MSNMTAVLQILFPKYTFCELVILCFQEAERLVICHFPRSWVAFSVPPEVVVALLYETTHVK